MKLAATISAALLSAAFSSSSLAQENTPKPLDWKTLEAPLLSDHIQLTSRDQFVKAGEAYFDHNSPPKWVIFQAVPIPQEGKDPDPSYSMYVARLTWRGERLSGIDKPIKISPGGSANSCGWFDPTNGSHVIFGSTLTRPSNTQRPGFQVGTRKYVWMFPHEMEIVSRTIPEIYYTLNRDTPSPHWGPDATTAKPIFTRPNYDAECSYSKDGRFILYAHVRDEPTRGKDDADIWVFDTQTGAQHEIVHADGYDGGPFFSPDNKRICYRSDRIGNDLLQLFVADLKFDSAGIPIGIDRELQITNNEHVNWAPFWHPSGKFLVYGTSQEGHTNYEVYAVEVPAAGAPDAPAEKLRKRRITWANGADVLPVFSDDGRYMMWTAQRGPKADGEEKPSSQVWVAKFDMPSKSGDVMRVFFAPRLDAPKSESDAESIVLKYLGYDKRPADFFIRGQRTRTGWSVQYNQNRPGTKKGPEYGATTIEIHTNGQITEIIPWE